MEGMRLQEPGRRKTCEDFERLLILCACDELEAAERAAVEEHTRQCAPCAASLAHELRLREAVAGAKRAAEKLDPSGALVSQCRSELEEALDDAGAGSHVPGRPSWRDAFRPANWLQWPRQWVMFHPALSGALLILLGVVVGVGLPRWYRAQMAPAVGGPAVTVSASPRLSDQDLQTMGVAGINWVSDGGSGSPKVELRLTAEKPLVVQGSLDDTDVKRVLTYVILNGQRFDSGVRLDSVDVLRARSADGDVREALCAAARTDRNPGVRLKALEAVRGFEQDDVVREALLDALLQDSNPGVRVEAINSLVGALRAGPEKGAVLQDQRVVRVLRDRMEKDPNNYIRMQSAAAIRQWGPRQVY